MPSTYSPNLRIELIGIGEQSNTWGVTTNSNLGTLIEQAIAGLVNVDVTVGDVTLTALNGASDESRNMILSVSGIPGTTRSIFAPEVSKMYIIANNSDSDVELATTAAGGLAYTIASGLVATVYTDGIDMYSAGISQDYVDSKVLPVLQRNGVTTTNVTLAVA